MISVLIPVYNDHVQALVLDLVSQLDKCNCPYEIRVLDDASTHEYQKTNKAILKYPQVVYNTLPKNVGRSAIRNILIEEAKYEHLLFLDSDSEIQSDLFIQSYLSLIPNYFVVCGGRTYRESAPENIRHRLHYTYGRKKESKPPVVRNRFPLRYFHTNNFLIKKQITQQILFPEMIANYGYEDLVFGHSLIKAGWSVKHIDNPVLHNKLIDTDSFLKNTAQANQNLLHFYTQNQIAETPFLKVVNSLNKFKLVTPIRQMLKFFKPLLIRNLYSAHPKMCILDLYKLSDFLNNLD
jgi:glycosyltransferase involved in cell wall biosynthesis